ncbi:UNVERIFIED_CONTAM: hypothetical protein K2H54_008216 [Gekko kuhli]
MPKYRHVTPLMTHPVTPDPPRKRREAIFFCASRHTRSGSLAEEMDINTPVRPFATPPSLLRPAFGEKKYVPIRRLLFTEENHSMDKENTMLPTWGGQHGGEMKFPSRPADEMDMGIPNPLWCMYRTPVEESEDEETPEGREVAVNESVEAENRVSESQLDEDFIQAFDNLHIGNPVDVNLSCVSSFCTDVTPSDKKKQKKRGGKKKKR